MEKVIYSGVAKDQYKPENFDKVIMSIKQTKRIIPVSEIDSCKVGIYYNSDFMTTIYYELYKNIINNEFLVEITLFGDKLENLEKTISENLASFKLQH